MAQFPPALAAQLPTLARGWDWWMQGFAMARRSNRPNLPVATYDPDGTFRTSEGKPIAKGTDVALLVPASRWLTLPVSFPAGADDEIARMAAFEISEQTPFAAEATHFDLSSEHGRTTQINLVPKRAVSEAVSAARAASVTIGQLRHADRREQIISLTSATPRKGRFLGILASLLIALFGFLGYELFTQDRAFRAASDRLTAMRRAAAQTRSIEAQIEALRAGAVIQPLIPDRPDTVAILEAITATLPDDSFLKAMRIGDGKVIISGQGRAIEQTIRELDQHKLFKDTRITAPLQRQDDGRVAFELSVTLEGVTE